MNIVCPLCKSKLYFAYHIDPSAKPEQRIDCPVCGYPHFFTSGFPIAKNWFLKNINATHYTGQSWQDIMKARGINIHNLDIPVNQSPLWTSVGEGIKNDTVKDISGIGSIGAKILKPFDKYIFIGAGILILLVILKLRG